MPGDDDPGGAITLQPPHGPESSLQPSVVGLDGIVCVDLRFMEGRREHLVEDPGVEAVPVGGDLEVDPGAANRLGEEQPRRIGVPARREVHVDDLAELVDRPEQVAPGPSDLEVGLIDMPAITDGVLSGSRGLGELGSKPLDPPVHGHVIDLDPALGQELLDVPVGQAEPQVPPDRQRDDFGREAIPGEGRARGRAEVRVLE